MSQHTPFLLNPEFNRRPWGTRDLAPIFDCTVPEGLDPVGEVWLTGADCEVREGKFRGVKLGELCQKFKREITGSASREPDRFPLLLKFLFTNEKLSVQVHPDDSTALSHGDPCGKAECWYVLRADPGAQIGLGLRHGTTKLNFHKAIQEGGAEDLLNWIDVHPQEMIWVAPGTVHTIGPGVVILEIQQNSETTYRLYDYGRPRPLHVSEGMEAMKECTDAGKIAPVLLPNSEQLIRSDYFVVDRYQIDGKQEFQTEQNYAPQCIVALEGSGFVTGDGFDQLAFEAGIPVIIPASVCEFAIQSNRPTTLIRSTLPICEGRN